MKLLQILQKCLEDWKNISHLDFCLVNLDNTIYISTCDRALPSTEKLDEFKDEEALCISNMNCRLYKVMENQCMSIKSILGQEHNKSFLENSLIKILLEVMLHTLIVQ